MSLARAIAAGEIVPWYQPIIALATGEVVGFEALARWVRRSGRVESPGAFIAAAEASDLIIDLDRAVLRQALADVSGWPADLRLSVNVSGRHLDRGDWLTTVIAEAAEAGVAPARVILELTETIRPQRLPAAAESLREARSRGFAVWLDDFGTGWADVADLVRLPADGLKIDHTLARHLGTPGDVDVRRLVAAAADHALEVTVEGVTTAAQAAAAHLLGCAYAQGFLWSPAVPAADLPALLTP